MKKLSIAFAALLLTAVIVYSCKKENGGSRSKNSSKFFSLLVNNNQQPSTNNQQSSTTLDEDHPHDISLNDANSMIQDFATAVEDDEEAIRYLSANAHVIRDYLSDNSIQVFKIFLAMEDGEADPAAFTIVLAGYDANDEYVPSSRNTYLEHINPAFSYPSSGALEFTTANTIAWDEQVSTDNSSITQHDISAQDANALIENYLSLQHPDNFIRSFNMDANELREYLEDGSIKNLLFIGALNDSESFTFVIAGENSAHKFVLSERDMVLEHIIPCPDCDPDSIELPY